ncbi:MAG: Clp1/GlmU family protein [Deltaproteobacteria bacterium]
MFSVMPAPIVYAPKLIADRLAGQGQRLLLCGASGSGKSTLAAALAREFVNSGLPCLGIGADPGSPAFGPPGAVCLGKWHGESWQLLKLEALCTLDAGRFRLPLVEAVRRLAERAEQGILLLDAPGIVRSVAGAELLSGLVDAAEIDTVLVLCHDIEKLPIANERTTLGRKVLHVQPSEEARPLGKHKRTRQRTRQWDTYLDQAQVRTMRIAENLLTGTPPPRETVSDWHGRQIALLREGRTLAMGEVLVADGRNFQIRIAETRESPDQFLIRDAFRNRQGYLTTFKRAGFQGQGSVPQDVTPYPAAEKNIGPRPLVRIGDATAILVNGVFGDPLLHLRIHNKKRSLLFDLGEGGRLPARLAHQVSDVFISHAHIDHISGFLWLLRSRIGMQQSCRLFGPPGLADRIESLINGIHWDRIGVDGPRFEVGDLYADHLLVQGLQAGRKGKIILARRPAPSGLLFADGDCRARAAILDHGGLPVLAFGLELAPKFNVIRDRLAERRLAPGPWLGELKKKVAADDLKAMILLPDGSKALASDLAAELLRVTPAHKLVYATDLSDTAANRQKLTGLASKAQVFFCEAAFLAADRRYAELSGHLTSKASGEIARAASVEHLVPFHFSRRYEKKTELIYDEVEAIWKRGVLKGSEQ